MTPLVRALALALVCSAPLGSASAQETEDDDRAASFVAVDGATTEDVPGGALLVGAYGAALALFVLYVVWLGRLQAGADREIARLSAVVEKAGRAPPKGTAEKAAGEKTDDAKTEGEKAAT